MINGGRALFRRGGWRSHPYHIVRIDCYRQWWAWRETPGKKRGEKIVTEFPGGRIEKVCSMTVRVKDLRELPGFYRMFSRANMQPGAKFDWLFKAVRLGIEKSHTRERLDGTDGGYGAGPGPAA